jgi:hypothetical protein
VFNFQRGLFTTGRSKFVDQAPWSREKTAKVYVGIQIDGLSQTLYAQVDTGAAWSILSPDLAREAGIRAETGDPAIVSTRFGLQRGYIVRIPFSLVADEGESLETTGAFFISPDWPPRQVFLGYTGLLDSIRFALDPQVNDFYFGPC